MSKAGDATDNRTMLRKLGMTFIFVLIVLPRMPDFGMGAAEAWLPTGIQRTQAALFDALIKVRADLQVERDSRR